MASNNPHFWQNPPFMGFNSYDQSTPTDYQRQSSAQSSYSHQDWSENPDEGSQRIAGGPFNPTFQPSAPYVLQHNSYSASPGNVVPVQHQPLNTSYSNLTPANSNADLSSGHHGDPFPQSSEEYRGRGDNFPPQQHTTFTNQVLAQLPAPPASYHPGGQSYHHQGLPFSDVGSDSSSLDLFGGSLMHSRVPSQDGCVYWYCAFVIPNRFGFARTDLCVLSIPRIPSNLYRFTPPPYGP